MKDLFSQSADQYRLFRPVYPEDLYEFIYRFVAENKTAWDCATGNGQAATVLAKHFDKVIATDIREQQINNAGFSSNLEYRKEAAEHSSLELESIDLITIAQAYHWFDFAAFAREARRVLKPQGIIAAWCYCLPRSENESVNEVIRHFYKDITAAYWDPERKYIDEKYATLPFPFFEIANPGFTINLRWTIEELKGYFNTWSAVKHYKERHSKNPIELVETALNKSWDTKAAMAFQFPIYLRLGKKSAFPG